jgi:4a-hydroxytetrahydrobiopterin dehydratase
VNRTTRAARKGRPLSFCASPAKSPTPFPHRQLTADGPRIRREWRVKDFGTALDFFHRVGAIAEAEDHHPGLHLDDYRNVAVELWTHAANGVTENDFILAARINELPVVVKK